jgi:hypothetical protein
MPGHPNLPPIDRMAAYKYDEALLCLEQASRPTSM